MKMFKRFAAALLAGVMVLAMLTACGGGAGGPGESEFEKKVQDVYMAALNKEYGTEWSNNSEVKELATEALNKIADGKIALTAVTSNSSQCNLAVCNFVQCFCCQFLDFTVIGPFCAVFLVQRSHIYILNFLLELTFTRATSATAAGGEHCQNHHAGQKGGCETLEHFHCNVPPVFKF